MYPPPALFPFQPLLPAIVSFSFARARSLNSHLDPPTDSAQPFACAILYAVLKAYRFKTTGTITWRTDLSHNPRRFQEVINHYEALLYLREDDDDEEYGGSTEVSLEHGGQPAMVMKDVSREPDQPDAMHRRTAGGVVGAGGGLDLAAMEAPAPALRPGDM
jgi:hypothetical protein